jgi:hypothetical protein
MFPGAPRLTADEITGRLRPALEKHYESERTARRAALKMADALSEWVDGAHNYRHAEGEEEPTPPPLALALVFMSSGAGFLRWLAEIDALGATTRKTT